MANPYEVAIHLTAHNGVSGVLSVLAKEMLGLNASVDKLNKGLSSLKAGVVGAVSLAAGAALLKSMEHLVDKGNAWVKVSRDMGQAGATTAQVMRAQAEAMKLTAQYTNMSSVEILKMQNDARMTFGDQDKATEHIKDFVEMASFLKSYEGHEKGSRDGESLMREVNAAMKSGELAGKINPEEMAEHIRQLTAMKVAYGDGLKISTYLAAQRTGGVALRNTSDEFRYGMFPALVQEQGSSAGVMLMTAFNKVVAGVGNRTNSLEFMNKMGLLNADQLEYDKAGRVKGLKDPDAIKGSREAAMNFGNWVMMTLKPMLDRANPSGDPIRESQMISKMFPDRNAAKAVTEIIQQFTKLSKDAEQMARARAALNIGQYNVGSWDYQMESFTTQWQNLMTHLGAPMVAGATRMLAQINDALSKVSQWVMNNPEIAKTIGTVLAGIGVGLAAIGVALVGTAIVGALGPAGWLVAGIAAIGAALAAAHLMTGYKPGNSQDPERQGNSQGRGWNGPAKKPVSDFNSVVHGFFESLRESIRGLSGEAAGSIGKEIGSMIVSAFKAVPGVYMAIVNFDIELAKTIGTEVMKVPGLLLGFIGGLAGEIAAAIGKALSGIGAAIMGNIPAGIMHNVPAPGTPGTRTGTPSPVPGREKHTSFVPTGNTRPVQMTATLTVDRRVLGTAVAKEIVDQNRTVSSSSGFDSGSHWSPPDLAMA